MDSRDAAPVRDPLPDLGVQATVVMDEHSDAPRTVSDEVKRDYRDVGVGHLEDIRIISAWSAHVAIYALQNPTPATIGRALDLLWQSGDFDEWQDFDEQRIGAVEQPPGWETP